MAEPQTLRCRSGDMAEYVDNYTALLDRLEAMDAKVPSELAVNMFLRSMSANMKQT
jgi:hypothetical protein